VKLISNEIEEALKNPEKWIDPYDSEKIKNRYLRGVSKRIALFYPSIFYKLNIFEKNVWDENYILLGQAALNINRKDLVIESLEQLEVSQRKHWGLPIDWHNWGSVYPRGTLMSTTTAECILFLCDVQSKYPELINENYLTDIAANLLNSLNKVDISQSADYLYSYTPINHTQVFNSNILVASAVGQVGFLYKKEEFIREAKKIIDTCEKYIPIEGFIPYNLHGEETTADSYHQLFSMRGLYYLFRNGIINRNLLDRTEKYFLESFLIDNLVILRPNSNVLDMQPYSEALRYFGILKDNKKFDELYSAKYNLMKKDRFIQRVWKLKWEINIKSNVCYSRQGYLRLLLALSYRYKL